MTMALIETYSIWSGLQSKAANGYLPDDNLWFNLKAPKVPPKPQLQVFIMPHSHADPGSPFILASVFMGTRGLLRLAPDV